jgi:hypothetical protein
MGTTISLLVPADDLKHGEDVPGTPYLPLKMGMVYTTYIPFFTKFPFVAKLREAVMITPEEFHPWSQRLEFFKETEALIAAKRSSSPFRPVTGRTSNVTGRYPGSKLEYFIHFESQHVELWAIYGMERDAAVLEFYDQASHIPLSYHVKSGHKTTQRYTPDFFLPKESAGWEEWKPAQPSIGCIEWLVDSTLW